MSSADEQTGFGIAAAREDELQRGTTIADGRFTIEALRGRGGMATVYLATDRDRGCEIALKIISPKYAGKPAAEQRLRNEAAFAERIGAHPNVARPLESGRLPDGRLYLATEFVRGPSLADLLAMERRIPTARACCVVRDIASALDAIHTHGVVHRDVKPDNVLVVPKTSEGGAREVAMLIDFGLAAEIAPTGERLTALHERPGTGLYMAPEQLAGARSAPSFDIYALGITTYEMLAGFAPNESRTAGEMLERKLERIPSIAELRPDLPPALVRLVDAMVEADPSRRVASAAAIVAALDGILDIVADMSDPGPELRPSAARAIAAPPVDVAAASRWPRLAGLVGAAVLVCGMIGWWIYTQRPSTPSTSAQTVSDAAVAMPPDPAPEPVAAPPSAAAPVPVEPPVAPAAEPPAEPVAEPVAPQVAPPSPTEPTKPRPSPSGPDETECAAKRNAAQAAYDDENWTAVLEATSVRACWTDKSRRTWLRVTAFTELERWSDCLREGEKAGDPKTKRLARLCREQTWRGEEKEP